MDDREVIRAFVADGAREGFGPSLHIERDALLFDGWWHAAVRIAPDAFIVRAEDPPASSGVLEDLADELSTRGLTNVGQDFPVVTAFTYAELSLGGGVDWALWSEDRSSGERALAARIGAETFFDSAAASDDSGASEAVADLTSELEGARRMFGLPPTVVVTVGLDGDQLRQLQLGLPECRFESMTLDMAPEACGPLAPTMAVVDATSQVGREFIMQLRAEACGRLIPVVALTKGELPLGADVALDPDQDPMTWVEPLRQLLPG